MRKITRVLLIGLLMIPAVGWAEVVDREVAYEDANGTALKGYLAYDDATNDKRPGVLVIHEWWGHNDYVRRRARELAELGYVAFALDMYGDGKLAEHPEDAGAFAGAVKKNRPVMLARFRAGHEYLKQDVRVAAGQVAAIGYCFGGSTVLEMARAGEVLRGVVSFHGSLETEHPAVSGSVKAKVLVCHGAADNFISPAAIQSFKSEMEAAGVDYRFKVYEGAKHSFTNPEADWFAKQFGLGVAYQKEADEASWQDMQAFFGEIFNSKEM
jgi:dienelactone hydrolase